MGVSKRILQARNPIIEVDIPTQSRKSNSKSSQERNTGKKKNGVSKRILQARYPTIEVNIPTQSRKSNSKSSQERSTGKKKVPTYTKDQPKLYFEQ
ncbi:5260_t:CDS:2 [Ambispora leptoticha]|uniref:5260_t:CDS:1 n=1 Tax=Ambispora leptoticha TaxID=144679 RepID=A0A9N9D111_9GLOM|nr:5260_t:CDS:2 [Ambispora leptoticha]